MAHRRSTYIRAVLTLTFVALLVAPIAASAASGLPATLTMSPGSAGPGEEVEVTGLDFPVNAQVDLQLTSLAGAVHLGTATTADGGFFRATLTLPADTPAGYWELRATGSNGSVAVHLFESGPAPLAVGGDATGSEAVVAAVSTAGNSSGDIAVLLVFAFIIAAVGGGTAYVYHQTRHGHEQPGMSSGEDPIWGGVEAEPEPAAQAVITDDAQLRTAQGEI